MKPLQELRVTLQINPVESSSSIKYIARQNLDFDVYLPTRGLNLQRPHVWTIDQKRELIMSMLIRRHIPHCAILNIIDRTNESKEVWQVIDGKQRLSAMIDFYQDKFTIELEGNYYLFSQLPNDYKIAIANHHIRYYVAYEHHEKNISDDDKIAWFKFINFAGTPQDKEHLQSL